MVGSFDGWGLLPQEEQRGVFTPPASPLLLCPARPPLVSVPVAPGPVRPLLIRPLWPLVRSLVPVLLACPACRRRSDKPLLTFWLPLATGPFLHPTNQRVKNLPRILC